MATAAERRSAARMTYREPRPPYGRSARQFIKREYGASTADAVGRSLARSAASGKLDLRKFKAKVRRVTTGAEARTAARNFRRQYKRNLGK